MDELLEILTDLHPEVDFELETGLIDNKILDSFDIITIIPENFNSAEALWALIEKLEDEE